MEKYANLFIKNKEKDFIFSALMVIYLAAHMQWCLIIIYIMKLYEDIYNGPCSPIKRKQIKK